MGTIYACSILSPPPLRKASALHKTRYSVATQTNDPTPPSGQRTPLSLDFTCHDNPAGGFYVNSSYGRVCVQTAPGVALTIAVKFCNGAPDPSNELKGTVYADSQGYYEWNWKPQPDCQGHPIWKGDVMVHAQLRGQSASFTTSFL